MTLKIGTIEELTGQGHEILIDSETREYVLARFYDGQMIADNSDAGAELPVISQEMSREKTAICH